MSFSVCGHNVSFLSNRHYERYEVSKTIEEQPGQSFVDRYVQY